MSDLTIHQAQLNVFIVDTFVGLQGPIILDKQANGPVVLATRGNEIITLPVSSNFILRIFEALANFFQGKSRDVKKISSLYEKSVDFIVSYDLENSYIYSLANKLSLYPAAKKCGNAFGHLNYYLGKMSDTTDKIAGMHSKKV